MLNPRQLRFSLVCLEHQEFGIPYLPSGKKELFKVEKRDWNSQSETFKKILYVMKAKISLSRDIRCHCRIARYCADQTNTCCLSVRLLILFPFGNPRFKSGQWRSVIAAVRSKMPKHFCCGQWRFFLFHFGKKSPGKPYNFLEDIPG